MEVSRFLDILKRHRVTLIAVPLLVVCITYMLVRNLPDSYSSKARLSSGLVDYSQQLLVDKDLQGEGKTNQAFSNLLQMLKMKKILDQVSYLLIIHDLTDPAPFRKPSKLVGYLTKDARKHAIDVYTEMYLSRQQLSEFDKDQNGLMQVISSMKYDDGSLLKKLSAFRVENSDFIDVGFESEDPLLSTFVVHALCKEFISYYTQLTKENELYSVNFLDTLLVKKKDFLDKRMTNMRKFMIDNHLLNIDNQTSTIYSQIAEVENQIQTVEKDVAANEGAIGILDQKINSTSRGGVYSEESNMTLNKEIVRSKQYLYQLIDDNSKSKHDPNGKVRIDSMKDVIERQVSETNDKFIISPTATKENLLNQKLNLEINQQLAKSSLRTLYDELAKLKAKYEALVPDQANIKQYEGDIEVANKDYTDILNKYNQSSLTYNTSVKLKLVQDAAPDGKQGAKKSLLMVVAGVVSLVFCLFVLFILFYIDNSIISPTELVNKTNTPVLGYLPLLANVSILDLGQVWGNKTENAAILEYKNQLRSVRYEIDNIIHIPKVIKYKTQLRIDRKDSDNVAQSPKLVNITSIKENQGKSLTAISLAGAFVMINKKVLLIDGNFNHPSITEMLKPKYFLEDYLTGKAEMPRAERSGEFVVLGNRGLDVSLFELAHEQVIKQKVQELKSEYDVIFIESSALYTLNKSREWNMIVDNIIAVFGAGNAISVNDMQQLAYLKGMNEKFMGWIMNKVESQSKEKSRKKQRRTKNPK